MNKQKTLIQDMSELNTIQNSDKTLESYLNSGWEVAHEEYKAVYHTGNMGALSFWRFVRLEKPIETSRF